MTPEELLYTKSHEWVAIESEDSKVKIAVVGLSDFAVKALTDLVFVELPEEGLTVAAGEAIAEVESVKAVSDIYSPVAGEVVEVNTDLPNHLERLSEDPYGDGWLMKIRIDDEAGLKDLLDYAAYQKQCAESA